MVPDGYYYAIPLLLAAILLGAAPVTTGIPPRMPYCIASIFPDFASQSVQFQSHAGVTLPQKSPRKTIEAGMPLC